MMSHQGHKLALVVFSEVRGEQYQFERLVQRMRDLADEDHKEEQQQSIAWECQTAGIQLFNAFASSPETIETRRSIRGELERRGLDDHLKVSLSTWMKACCLAYLFMCGDCFAVLGIGEKTCTRSMQGSYSHVSRCQKH